LSEAWPLAAGGALVAAGAAVAGLGPRRLLAELEAPARMSASITAAAVVMGLGVYAVGLAAGAPAIGCGLGILAAILVVVFAVDLRTLTIPDLSVVMIASLALIGPIRSGAFDLFTGAAVGAGLLWAVRWAFHRLRRVEALGLGDVKLMGALGALAGPQLVLWIVVAGAVLGIAWAALRRGRTGAEMMIPFGAAAAAPAFLLIGWDRLAG
jgi:leader peptidase (prepilin peptidase)/N-methyltransferase